MDVFTFITIAVIGSFVFVGFIIHTESQKKSKQKMNSAENQQILDKLDNALSRIETLERLALDEDQSLKREFKDIQKSA